MDDFNFIEESRELHLYGDGTGKLPRDICRMYGFRTFRLNATSTGLRTTRGLDMFPNIQEMMIDNNSVDMVEISRLPHLHTLSINNNKIEDLDQLLVSLQRCTPKLRYLSLLGNPCSPDQLTSDRYTAEDYMRHRLYVLYMLPQLEFLDSRSVTAQERVEAKRRGRFCRTVRAQMTDPAIDSGFIEWAQDALDGPIAPESVYGEPESHGAAKTGPVYGMLRYRYTGKHSEGNRFIRNKDL